MDPVRFILTAVVKTLALAIFALLAVKAAGGLRGTARGVKLLRAAAYAGAVLLALFGARGEGLEVAAGIHGWASENAMAGSEIPRAYSNALRAVELRPDVLLYWQMLSRAKFALRECHSLLKDQPVLEALAEGEPDPADQLRAVDCFYSLGDYDSALALSARLIRRHRYYPAPYVLQGMAYTCLGKYDDAARAYLTLLQIFPNQAAAVEGLAHVYFLAGNRVRALEVLNDTGRFRFTPAERKHFEALKTFYAQ